MLGQPSSYVIDREALKKAVAETNSGRDDALAQVLAELAQVSDAITT